MLVVIIVRYNIRVRSTVKIAEHVGRFSDSVTRRFMVYAHEWVELRSYLTNTTY